MTSEWSSPVELVDGRMMIECRCPDCRCDDQVVAYTRFAVCDACANGQHARAKAGVDGASFG